MELVDLNQYEKEVTCTYRNETYNARDNGSVLRYSSSGKRTRPTDNLWTFGKPNKKTGYFEIASVRVHRIVATAFHGVPPTKEHVVDHIDTNRQNNRPENLRWVTKLENILLNPITAKRIAMVCGSVEAFLENPAKFRDKFQDPNFKWMGIVTKEEGQNCLTNLTAWAKSDKQYSGGSLDKWIYNRYAWQNQHFEGASEVSEIMMAKSPKAAQINWRVPSEFPCCPLELNEEPIAAYFEKLITGSVFCRNEIYSSFVLKSAISEGRKRIYVISESTEGEKAVKPWALAKITFEDGLFLHTSLGSFLTQLGAEKQFCLAQGLEWNGGDSIDDYC